MRGNSRSLRHLPQTSTNTLTSVLHKPRTAVRLQPGMHRASAGQTRAIGAGERKCSCVDTDKQHVFRTQSVGCLKTTVSFALKGL